MCVLVRQILLQHQAVQLPDSISSSNSSDNSITYRARSGAVAGQVAIALALVALHARGACRGLLVLLLGARGALLLVAVGVEAALAALGLVGLVGTLVVVGGRCCEVTGSIPPHEHFGRARWEVAGPSEKIGVGRPRTCAN
jgi:hypothetical protein